MNKFDTLASHYLTHYLVSIYLILTHMQLLSDGLNDHSDLVQEACVNGLLRNWSLESLNGDFITLLSRLDVESSQQVDCFYSTTVCLVILLYNVLLSLCMYMYIYTLCELINVHLQCV